MQYYSDMIPTLARRASSGALSSFGFSNNTLRAFLENEFSNSVGEDGSFIGDPAFEAVFGWETSDKTFEDLGGNLLHPDLIEALDKSDLKKQFHPYIHQETSWSILSQEDPQSVIISSGTGSGKTECFMIPILDRLIEEREATKKQLQGVRTLFLYPLNALINSQRERLDAWTKDFGRDIRFCLYNGLTPEKIKEIEKRETPNEVRDRETLRENPPPILVTNPTMLEYMLVRAKDNPIIEQSKGLLDTVVLDEAHTYIGSQAAEMTLLLRRVLHAFGKKPSEVRFVATSATIGEEGEKARENLKSFMQQIAGVNPSRVHVVEGKRKIPSLKLYDAEGLSLDKLEKITDPEDLYAELEKNKTARQIRSLFTENKDTASKLSDVCKKIYNSDTSFSIDQQIKGLKWLDVLSSAKSKNKGAFLPLRAHIFQKTFPGIWACADKQCSEKKNHHILNNDEWPFGMVYLQNQRECKCGAPVYEVVSCKECGDVYLDIEIKGNKVIQPAKDENFDEFELEVDDDPEAVYDEEKILEQRIGNEALIVNRSSEKTGRVYLDRETREICYEKPDNGFEVKIREYADEPNGLPCPNCHDSSRVKYKRFRRHTIGAPSMLNVLLPTLLQYAEEDEESTELPFNGRKLLTFNDSRQGTARIAAKLQQDSERSKARGLIYHYVLRNGQQRNQAEIEKIENRIKTLEEASKGQDESLNKLIEEDKKELDKLKAFTPVPFEILKGHIAKEDGDFGHIVRRYRKHDPILFSQDSAHAKVAELLIFREFARRPRRQNNLETLGLISLDYPSIDKINDAPSEWKRKGLTIDEWKTYLKICIDFFVRAGGSLEGFERNLRNWLGLPFYKTYLIAQDEEASNKFQRRWPTAKRGKHQSRIVRLLIKLLGVDPDTSEGEDIIDDTLYFAWNDLKRTNTLEAKEDGYVLDLSKISFTIPSKVWICPITRRFLDKTIRGITPYLPKTLRGNITCEEFSIPRYPEPFGNTQNPFKNRELAQEWLRNQEEIETLRKEGYWTIFNDRVIEYMPYYEAAEHSAQIDSGLLKHYEKQFKEGRINILSCSTTMEMGIDIGGIRMVGMNNLPPHPANYLQRAGRAGRRKEARSTTMTLCKNNPHDLSAFQNSKWAFDTKLPAPNVSLNSKVIVQRHINAFLLSHYLNEVIGFKEVDKYKLTTGWFFLNEEQGVKKYEHWIDKLSVEPNEQLFSSISMLVRGSVFDGQSVETMLENSDAHIEEISEKWKMEYESIQSQRNELSEELDESDPSIKAIEHQLNRLTEEYLLRELASKGFLPGYGFPSNITAFDHYNVSTFKREKREQNEKSRDDNVHLSRDLPSRDIVSALREYAPGADVVLDGAVYRSEGITLNWHIPTSVKEVKESQAIRYAWRCDNCGFSGSTYDKQKTLRCESCGSQIKSRDIEQYLEPSGFSVDFYASKHNDVTTQTYIPIEKPWIQIHGDWVPLSNPGLGRYRATTNGHIFHFSKGIHGEGYALCLMCGKAEPMDKKGELPKKFKNGKTHRKLRGGKNKDDTCPGSKNRWAIKEGIALGHQMNTDILQFVLKDVHGEWLTNRNIAATLAVVLRDSLAELLGIQSMELLCDVQQTKIGKKVVESILIFDRNSSGFSSNAGHLIHRMFEEARNRLICPNNCKASCPNCVLDYDQRFREDELDRHIALQFLTEEWINKNKLPKELNYFGDHSEIEQESIFGAIIKELDINPGKVHLFADGDSQTVDISISYLRKIAMQLSYKKVPVNIIFEKNTFENLPKEDLFTVHGLLQHEKIGLKTCSSIPTQNGAKTLAGVAKDNNWKLWASAESSITNANEDWGKSNNENSPIVTGTTNTFDFESQDISEGELQNRLKGHSDKEIVVKGELNNLLHSFGKRFWNFIGDNHEDAKSSLFQSEKLVKKVIYKDRYLHNPLSLGLVFSIVRGLNETIGNKRWNNATTHVTTTHKQHEPRPGNLIFHDWMEPEDRDEVFKILFGMAGLDLELEIKDRRDMEHARSFKVIFEDNTILFVRLDQGVGYWKVENPRYTSDFNKRQQSKFEFSIESGEYARKKEAEQIMDKNPKVVCDSFPTQIFVKVRAEQ